MTTTQKMFKAQEELTAARLELLELKMAQRKLAKVVHVAIEYPNNATIYCGHVMHRGTYDACQDFVQQYASTTSNSFAVIAEHEWEADLESRRNQ